MASSVLLPPTLLIVATHVAPAKGYGGVAESVSDLARVWTEQGHRVRLVASNASMDGRITFLEVEALTKCKVSLYSSKFIKKQGFGLAAIPRLWSAINEADNVYIAGVSTWPTTIALLFCRLQFKKFGLGVRGGFLRGHISYIRAYKPIKYIFYHIVVQPLANGAHFIHAMSEMEREHIASLFKPPVVKASLGVDCRFLRMTPPLEPLPSSGWRYLYVGRFSREKSVLAMVEAWRIAARSCDRLTLTGDGLGMYAKAVRSLANDDSRISMTGYMARGEVFQLIRQHHYLILPSGIDSEVRENFGIIVAEALTLGRPVLVARNLAWNHIEKFGAGIVFPASKEGLINAIRYTGNISYEEYRLSCKRARMLAVLDMDITKEANKLWLSFTNSKSDFSQ